MINVTSISLDPTDFKQVAHYYFSITYIYPPIKRKRMVSLSFEQGVSIRLGIVFSEVSGPYKGGGVPLIT